MSLLLILTKRLINIAQLKPYLSRIALLLLVSSLVFSKFGLSVSIILLVVNALLSPNKTVKNLRENKVYLALIGGFVILALSGIYSENIEYLAGRLKVKLPFLLLPIGFAGIGFLSRKTINSYLYLFFLLVGGAMLFQSADILFNFSDLKEKYLLGKTLSSTFVSHIQFSLFVACSICLGIYFILTKYQFKYSWEKYLQIGLVILLILFLHIYAVRSGLLAMYLAAAFSIFWLFIRTAHRKLAVVSIVLLGLGGLLAINFVPTIKNKLAYVKWDLKQLEEKADWYKYSDSRRLVSIDVGLKTGLENPVFGSGLGDLRVEGIKQYNKYYPKWKNYGYMIPHNQFVFMFAALGMLGLLVFIFTIIFPLVYEQNYSNLLFSLFHVIILSSFLSEATLEVQVGTSFYLIFLLLGSNFLNLKPTGDG